MFSCEEKWQSTRAFPNCFNNLLRQREFISFRPSSVFHHHYKSLTLDAPSPVQSHPCLCTPALCLFLLTNIHSSWYLIFSSCLCHSSICSLNTVAFSATFQYSQTNVFVSVYLPIHGSFNLKAHLEILCKDPLTSAVTMASLALNLALHSYSLAWLLTCSNSKPNLSEPLTSYLNVVHHIDQTIDNM